MYRNLLLLSCIMVVAPCIAGCGSSHGGIWPTPVRILKLGALTIPTETITAGDVVQFKITWTDGRSPFTVSWDFDGGMEPPELETSTGESPHIASVTAINGADKPVEYQGVVTITDMDGTVVFYGFSYTVEPAP